MNEDKTEKLDPTTDEFDMFDDSFETIPVMRDLAWIRQNGVTSRTSLPFPRLNSFDKIDKIKL
jgi:hypothetical protein